MTPQIKYDGQLQISVGRHRRETNWKNKEILWSGLVEKISTTHRTAETYASYLASKKDRQDEIKDVGGFVGGYLTGGKRRASSVLNRCLLTLDIDFGKTDFWEDFTLVYGSAAALYSTHKHSEATPRYRLVIPLSREVFPDEYQAIGRKVAGALGIELFDPSTFQPERLMYWPSTAQDGEFIAELQDGPWLDADAVLAEYRDWKDTSQWPVSEKVDKLVKRSMDKQGDPLEKTGVVGAFCRTYSIIEAIDKYLGEVYTPCTVPGRFTYKEGSTSAGLVIYEDKWAYSHHGTDPISGKLCNAFDLVRLHLFGLKDEDARDGTPGNKLPSFTAMIEHATKDKDVRKLIGAEKIQEALADFTDTEIEGDITDDDWISELDVDKKGNYTSSIHNCYMAVKNSPDIKNRLWFDEFENALIATSKLPWRKVNAQTKHFSDEDEDCMAGWLERMQIPFTQLPKALSRIKTENRFHPVKRYLDELVWDGTERLNDLLTDYLGAASNDYTAAVIRKTLIGAVSRIYEPGCKFDTVMVLVGSKGIFKSEFIKRLFGEWFSDTMGDIHKKEGMEALRSVWGMEIAELDAFKRADIDAIKRFITSRQDVYRPAYGRQIVRFPRQCIFIGTTNKFDFVQEADERRFLPVLCRAIAPEKNVWVDLTADEVAQIWAEAVEAYKAGESSDLSTEAKEIAQEVREQHAQVDDRAGLVIEYLEKELPEDWDKYDVFRRRAYLQGDEEAPGETRARKHVCVAEIWCELFGGMHRDMNTYNTKFIHDILKQNKGWVVEKNKISFSIYGRQRGYKRVLKINALS